MLVHSGSCRMSGHGRFPNLHLQHSTSLKAIYRCQNSKPYPLLNPTLCPARSWKPTCDPCGHGGHREAELPLPEP